MPDTYANPLAYNSPIGTAVANLSRSLLSGPSEAERIREAEAALKLKREREAITSLADVFGAYGQPGFNRNNAMSSAVLAGYDPSNLGEMERYAAANTYGAADPRTTNAFVGAGGAYGSTAAGFNATLGETTRNNNLQSADRRYGVDQTVGENKYEFDNVPKPALGPDGKPVFLPQSGLTGAGVQPILTNTERQGTLVNQNWGNLGALPPQEQTYLGADPSKTKPTPHNYVGPDGKTYITYDGVTSARDGSLLPPGGYIAGVNSPTAAGAGLTTGTRTGLQESDVANQTLKTIIGVARETVLASPDVNFGVSGNIKTLAQNLSSIATNLASGLGFTGPADALASFQTEMRDSKVDPSIISGIFDPRLGELSAVYGTLVYATARALSGGGTLSNQDVQAARDSIGDPFGLFANKQTLLSKLDAVEKMLNAKQGVVNSALNPNRAGAPAPPVAAGEQPAPGPQTNADPAFFQQRGARAGLNFVNLNPQFAPRAAAAISAAEAATGQKAVINSGYRTNAEQTQAWNNYQSGQGGLAAKPGTSYHESGNALDIAPGPVLDWLHAHASEYGVEFLTGEAFAKDPVHMQMAGSYAQFDGNPFGVTGKPPAAGAQTSAVGSPAAPGGPSAAGPLPSGAAPLPNGYAVSAPMPPLPQFKGAAPWTPGGKTASNGVVSPKGEMVPTSFLRANGGDADLWDYFSPAAKEAWRAQHGD